MWRSWSGRRGTCNPVAIEEITVREVVASSRCEEHSGFKNTRNRAAVADSGGFSNRACDAVVRSTSQRTSNSKSHHALCGKT